MMKSWHKILLATLLFASLGLAACGGEEPEAAPVSPSPSPEPAETVTRSPDAEAKPGEYTHQILTTRELGINEYSSEPPGQSTILPREYPGAPPLVPHDISVLTITKDQNPCLACHIPAVSFGPDHTATKIPESHYTDIPTGQKSEDVQPIRYNCTLCHIPQSAETPPLER